MMQETNKELKKEMIRRNDLLLNIIMGRGVGVCVWACKEPSNACLQVLNYYQINRLIRMHCCMNLCSPANLPAFLSSIKCLCWLPEMKTFTGRVMRSIMRIILFAMACQFS